MRPSRIVCLVLAALDAVVLATLLSPDRGEGLGSRVPIAAGKAKAGKPSGPSVPFRLRGEVPAPALVASAPAEAPPEPPIDSACFAYLGTMTSPELGTEYFFKDRTSGRVYSTWHGDGSIKVLEASEKEFLIEIDGTKYEVGR